jgi:hypothetical protein
MFDSPLMNHRYLIECQIRCAFSHAELDSSDHCEDLMEGRMALENDLVQNVSNFDDRSPESSVQT